MKEEHNNINYMHQCITHIELHVGSSLSYSNPLQKNRQLFSKPTGECCQLFSRHS